MYQTLTIQEGRWESSPAVLKLSTLDILPFTAFNTPEVKSRRVRFSTNNQVHEHITIDDFSDQEILDVWFSAKESDAIRKACTKQIILMERGNTFNDVKFCSRGLESHTSSASMTKQMNRITAIASVLDEQERQTSRLDTEVDDEEIRKVYQNASHSSELWARRVALLDQKDAEEI